MTEATEHDQQYEREQAAEAARYSGPAEERERGLDYEDRDGVDPGRVSSDTGSAAGPDEDRPDRGWSGEAERRPEQSQSLWGGPQSEPGMPESVQSDLERSDEAQVDTDAGAAERARSGVAGADSDHVAVEPAGSELLDADLVAADTAAARPGAGAAADQPGYRDQSGVPTDRPDLATVGQPAGGDATLVQEPDNLRSRWQEVQIGFVDGPRTAVQAADELVQEVLHEVQQRLADERSGLEARWSRGEAG